MLAVFMILIPRQVFSLFTEDAEVLDMASSYALIAVLMFNGSAVWVPFSALVSGQGNAKLSLTIVILDGIVARVRFSILLGKVFGYGVMGFWLGDVIASHIPALVGGVYHLTGVWKRFHPLSNK